jgi:hypothetical protein
VTVLLDQSSKWRLEGNTEEGDEKVVDNGVEEDNMLRGDMVPTFIVSCLSQITPLLCEKYELKGRE